MEELEEKKKKEIVVNGKPISEQEFHDFQQLEEKKELKLKKLSENNYKTLLYG